VQAFLSKTSGRGSNTASMAVHACYADVPQMSPHRVGQTRAGYSGYRSDHVVLLRRLHPRVGRFEQAACETNTRETDPPGRTHAHLRANLQVSRADRTPFQSPSMSAIIPLTTPPHSRPDGEKAQPDLPDDVQGGLRGEALARQRQRVQAERRKSGEAAQRGAPSLRVPRRV
jgi:hypothetical protein